MFCIIWRWFAVCVAFFFYAVHYIIWYSPVWALIDIQSFSALIQRFLRFQRCSELNQPTLILTSLVITDSVMNISEHLWFSAKHYWQSANRQRPWKKPKQVVFFNIDAEETRNRKFQNNFWWVNLKNSKNVIFPKSVFSSDSMAEDFLLEQKKWKIPKYLLQSRKKNFTGVSFDVFTVFLREHVQSQRQQCSWLGQKKSVMFRAESLFFRNDAEKISYFQSWFSIVQNSSESIRRSRITSQVLLPNHILGGAGIACKE